MRKSAKEMFEMKENDPEGFHDYLKSLTFTEYDMRIVAQMGNINFAANNEQQTENTTKQIIRYSAIGCK